MMDDAALDALALKVSNWGRWGDKDELGTLNLVTPELTARAATLVSSGRTVSLARTLPLDQARNSSHVVWRIKQPIEAASEFIGIDFHGSMVTHVDALNHIHRDGRMFNDFDAAELVPRLGSDHLTVETMGDGVASRGVLLDLARARGGPMSGSEAALPNDLEAAERQASLKVGAGDIVFVRTGANAYERDHGSPGMGPECVPWFRERDIAMLGADVANDIHPCPPGRWDLPVHQLTIFHMGMPLIDNCTLEPLAEACEQEGRYEFFCLVAPVRIKGGTGSPLNPIAVF